MIICKRPVPPDNNLQKARPSGWSFARGQPCGQPHGWTDGTIKSSTRGPRGPKKTKQRKQSSYTNKRKNLYFFIAGHLYSALLLLINANKKHWNIHISQGSKLENVQLHEYIENIWKWMAVHPLLLICCGCRCCLARNFWNSCSFFFLRRRWNFSPQQRCRSPAAAQVRHGIYQIFYSSEILKSFHFTWKFLNCDSFCKIARILEVLIIYFDQIISLFANFCSNTKSTLLFWEKRAWIWQILQKKNFLH